MTDAAPGPGRTVRRRRAFFIHGFDPRSTRTYYRHFAEQIDAYRKRFGVDVSVGPMAPDGPLDADWTVDATVDGVAVETSYRFLSWADLASGHLKHGFWRLLGEGAWTWVEMLRTGHWRKVSRADRGIGWLILYPHAMIAVYPLLALLCGWLIAAAAEALGTPGQWSPWIWAISAMSREMACA